MFERFTSDARTVVVGAQECALERGDRSIGTHHLLLAMARRDNRLATVLARHGLTTATITAAAPPDQGASIDEDALRSVGVDLDEIRRRTEDAFGAGSLDAAATEPPRSGFWPRRQRRQGGHIPFTDDAKQAIENSLREAIGHGDRTITSAHLALGVLATASGKGGRMMASHADGGLRADLIDAIAAPLEPDDGGGAGFSAHTG